MGDRLALIWCSQDERIEYRNEMVNAFCLAGEQWDVLNPFKDSLKNTLGRYDGYVIGGSEYSVNDDTEWVKGLLDFIRAAKTRDLPLVGICFGSQAISIALGGKVDSNPDGRFYFNVESIVPNKGLQQWLSEERLPAPKVVESHGECVTELPEHAVRLASSERTVTEIFVASDRILGIQGHPEISKRTTLEKFLPVHLKLDHIDDADADQLKRELASPLEPDALIKLARMALSTQLGRFLSKVE